MDLIKNIIIDDDIFLGSLPGNRKPNLAIFLSGSGSNAEKLLADKEVRSAVNVVVVVTDAPEKSRAGEIAAAYNIPLVELSIRAFYREHGLKTISLATEEGRRVRELWTAELCKRLEAFNIDFGVLAGFEPLCNVTEKFPCLNVHPGDLSVTNADGVRLYVGLHSRPVEAALLAGETTLRSSVIIAGTLHDANKDMDNGLLLGISQPMPVKFEGLTLDKLKLIKSQRSGKKPAGGWKDELENLALRSQDELKVCGDHIIFPLVVRDFARKCFALKNGKLYYRQNEESAFAPAESMEYTAEGVRKN